MGFIDNPAGELADLMMRVRVLETQSGADGSGFGDGDHPGSGDASLQLGPGANAAGESSAAAGDAAWATGARSTAVGFNTFASGADSTAVGSSASAEHDNSAAFGKNAMTTATWQIMLGSPSHTVATWNAISVLSARRLKRHIVEAPSLRSIFPAQYEWEYIDDEKHRRHVGPIADELVGTDAEQFLTFDDDGQVSGIDKLGLYGAQISVLRQENDELRARLTALENRS